MFFPRVSPKRLRTILYASAGFIILSTVTLGIFAKNNWLPNTDSMTGEKTGWFGSKLPKNASSSWNPLAAPLPTATPQLARENLYAGSRLLAVVDANANETPPADLAVWRPSSGVWYVYNLVTSSWMQYSWGTSGDTPMQGDYDGDGKTDFAIVRPTSGTFVWYIDYSGGGSTQFTLGLTSDTPLVADFDGDGKSDPTVYRPSNGNWYWRTSADAFNTVLNLQFGLSTDVPAPADYDGDGKADIAVWRNSNTTFYSANSSDTVVQTVAFSSSADKPVPADYDGDGKANYAIRNGASWLIMNTARSSTTTTTPTAGSTDLASDIPVPNDYDGDGKVDIAVWRNSNGNWYIRKSGSANALRQEAWGTTNDIPVAAFWRR